MYIFCVYQVYDTKHKSSFELLKSMLISNYAMQLEVPLNSPICTQSSCKQSLKLNYPAISYFSLIVIVISSQPPQISWSFPLLVKR